VFNCSNTVKIEQHSWKFWFSGNSGASRENLNYSNAVAVVQTTVQTVQPERITYLLEQLLGGGVKKNLEHLARKTGVKGGDDVNTHLNVKL